MNILYDISWLGLMHARKQSRTGLVRAIECTAKALQETPGCTVRFTGAESYEALVGVEKIVANGTVVAKASFAAPPASARLATDLADYFNQLGDRWAPKKGTGAFRRAAMKTQQWGGVRSHLVNLAQLKEADVFHSQYMGVPGWLRQFPHLKFFVTVYDLIPILFPETVTAELINNFTAILESIHRDDHVICISEHTKLDLCRYRKDLDPERVHVAYLGASEAFRPCTDQASLLATRKKYSIPEGKYVLGLSTLSPHKNFGRLIESFATLLHDQKIPDLTLVISGGAGWNMQVIKEALIRWNVAESRVVLPGYVADEDLPGLYGAALAFIFPSLYEGFGLPVLEAMQCGTPVICSNASSIPEVAGDAALYFDPTDGVALSAAIWKIYKSEALRSELAAKSLVQAAKFSWSRCAEETMKAYRLAVTS